MQRWADVSNQRSVGDAGPTLTPLDRTSLRSQMEIGGRIDADEPVANAAPQTGTTLTGGVCSRNQRWLVWRTTPFRTCRPQRQREGTNGANS